MGNLDAIWWFSVFHLLIPPNLICSAWFDVLQKSNNAAELSGKQISWRYWTVWTILINFPHIEPHFEVQIFHNLFAVDAQPQTSLPMAQGFELSREARAQADIKFTYVVSCQIYGQQKQRKAPEAADIALLLRRSVLQFGYPSYWFVPQPVSL